MKNRYVSLTLTLIFSGIFILLSDSIGKSGGSSAPGQDYEDLVLLFREFREFQKPKVIDGVPDYTPEAMNKQGNKIKDFQSRLASIDARGWPISQQVDYYLVRAEMNGLEFDHRVLRPWFRDPAFYVPLTFQFGPKMHGSFHLPQLPLSQERIPWLKTKLKAIPKILEQAKGNLKEGAVDLAMLGIRSKEREIALMDEYIPRLREHHLDLVPSAEKALEALKDFKSWLETNKNMMTAPAGIGIENYNWYLKNVQLLPYTWEELLAISQREYERALACMKLEEHRNRHLPPLIPVSTAEDYIKLFNSSQSFLYDFLKTQEILTVTDTFQLRPVRSWRRGSVRDYFAQIQDRDPLPLMPHDFVGHSPDAIRHRLDERPIRGTDRIYFIDGIRAEALATGMEEILMHTGLLDGRSRSRELAYNLLAFRAARAISDLRMHSLELSLMEGFQFNIDKTPFGWLPEDSRTMWHDIELYLRQPTYGVGYLIGSVQLQKLLADRGDQLGEEFKLKAFMDEFLAAGMIPLSLIRWEMTGLDDEIQKILF
ncbi:MAG: DUF885 family protein [Candidatus Aminicenantes bacterium]|nr:DUF885 family protein [Candidatus Aminicenantes bacterium]